MIYRFSKQEWIILQRKLAMAHTSLPFFLFHRVQTVIVGMQHDHTIYTKTQLDSILILLRAPVGLQKTPEIEKMPGACGTMKTHADELTDDSPAISRMIELLQNYWLQQNRNNSCKNHMKER